MVSFVCSLLYMIIIIGIGYLTSRKNDTTEKYYAAERSVSWPLVGMMLFAFIFAGPTITGPIASGYSSGIECMWACEGMAIGCLWFILGGCNDLYRVSGRHGAMSVPGVFSYRFDEKTRLMMMVYMTIVFTIFFTLQIGTIGTIFSGLLNVSYLSMAIFVTILYIGMAWFGFKGVAWQNVVHNIVMVVGFGLLVGLSIHAAGGWHAMVTELPASYWNPWAPNFNTSGADLLSAVFQCAVSGTIITCAFVAKDRHHAKLGYTFGLILAAIYALFAPLSGMAARIIFGEGQDPNMIATMLTDKFGTVTGVLVTMAIVAATCSTAPGLLMVVVNALVNDLYPAVKKDCTDTQKMFLTRILLFVVGAFSTWLSFTFVNDLLGYLFFAFAINSIAGCILWLSHFVPKLNAKCAFWGMLVGIIACFASNAITDAIQPFWIGMLVGNGVTLLMAACQKEVDPKFIAYRKELQHLKDHPDLEYKEYLERMEQEKLAQESAEKTANA